MSRARLSGVINPLMLILLTVVSTSARADSKSSPEGDIKGTVVDTESQLPAIGVSVVLGDTERGAMTDDEGHFAIKDVPVGTYVVKFRSVGYAALTRTDVVVRPGRITYVSAELHPTTVQVQDIVVSAGYFAKEDNQPTSSTSFSSEEIRRAPGSAGDVSRIIHVLPSIAKVDDQLNSLVVRGGSPSENGFYLDNIEIPNINHYPLQGTSGGPISLLNVDFIEEVEFSAGGFPASYGDRLSSIMELSYREGNREEFDAQLDLNMAGIGLAGEGPISGGQGSWMLSVRRSYLDLLVDAIATGVAPKFSDYQGKVVYDLSNRSQMTLLGVAGVDYISFDSATSYEDGNQFFGEFRGHEYAIGVNWRYLWGGNGFSNTSIGYNAIKYHGDVKETWPEDSLNGDSLFSQYSVEAAIGLRNINHYRLGDRHQIEFGGDFKYHLTDYSYTLYPYTNTFGADLPRLEVDEYTSSPQVGGFVSHIWNPWPRLTATVGVRYDYLEYVGRGHLAPRLSMSYKLSPRTSVNGAFGVYRQFIPLSLTTQRDQFKDLAEPISRHYILGLSHLLAEDTRLTIETYYKDYHNFPMDPAQPGLFIADELGFARMVGNFATLSDQGTAWAAGVEATIQKKLVSGVYGLLSSAYYRTRYMGLDGKWRDRLYDNRIIVTAEGGYKPNSKWEFSVRWIFAGGRPRTPLDIAASIDKGTTVKDDSRIHAERIPDYHSLNVRFDRRFHFKNSSLIAFFSVWNAYNRKNISTYFWNEGDNKEDIVYQWSILPVGGLEFEF